MERFTKLLLVAWVAVAFAAEAWLLSGGWPQLPLRIATLVLVAAIAASITPRAVSVVLLATYVVQVLVRLTAGGPVFTPYVVVWLAPLFGAMLPDLLRTPWHLPARWRGPLVAGALVVAVCCPIVVLREADFTPGLLLLREQWHLVSDIWPSLLASWIGFTALTLVLGVLWFDWLCGQPPEHFERDIVTPLIVSVGLLIAVTVYQFFVDVSFLNESVYGAHGRAGGTTYDANVSGMLAALWIGGMFVRSQALGVLRMPVGVAAASVAGLAVWATASGSALVTAAAVALFTALDAVRGGKLRVQYVVSGGLVIVLVGGLILASSGETISPLVRLQRRFQGGTGVSATQVVTALWSRDGYGPSAVRMVQAHPWTGVGVGMFHSLASSFSTGELPPDNAQNWLRHQVAELGILGSAPWLLWFLLFAAYVLRFRRDDRPGTLTLRGVLIALGAISMISMPSQHPAVAMTFWTIANWLRIRTGPVEPTRPMSGIAWSAVVLVVTLSGVSTAVVAGMTLRPPQRGLATDAPYSYGLGSPDARGFRPAFGRVVSVVDASTRLMRVTVTYDPRPSDEPVDLRVTVDGRSVLKGHLSSPTELSGTFEVPDGTRRLLLEATADRADDSLLTARMDATPRYDLRWEFVGDRPIPARAPGH